MEDQLGERGAPCLQSMLQYLYKQAPRQGPNWKRIPSVGGVGRLQRDHIRHYQRSQVVGREGGA